MKKKFLPKLIALFFIIIGCSCLNVIYAADTESSSNLTEVELEVPENIKEDDNYNIPEAVSISAENTLNEQKSLKEKLRDIYNLEIEKYDKPSYLMEEIFTHKYSENSPLDYTHFWAGYNGELGIKFQDNGSVRNHYDFNAITASVDGVLKDNNADFRFMLRFMPYSHRNVMQTMFSDTYIGTNKIPHHRIQIGYFRPKVGHEGTLSTYVIPFLNRAQISREFGTVRKIGGKIEGDYKYLDYNLGLYSSGTFFKDFFPGAEFDGWINIKPLANTKGKYGNLKIGGGLQGGHRDNDYCVTGAYVGWEYKKFMANFEWASANGYNGNSGYSTKNHADGFYGTIGYMLTKKLQLLARYDQFDPNKHVTKNTRKEYSVGLNYFIKGQALKLILNYVFCDNQGTRDSHRIIIGTQIIL